MNYKDISIAPDKTIKSALQILDATAKKILFVVDDSGKLLGTVTDGDIRRGILKDTSLSDKVTEVMKSNPKIVRAGTSREEMLRLMKQADISHLPVLDQLGKLVDVISRDELLDRQRRNNIIVLMAGGLGTRLRPLTNDCPKPMLKIGKKPILETIIDSFIDCGFYRFYLAVNYRSEVIEEYFGDGCKWGGVEIKYIHEKKRMGTAGALYFLPENQAEPIIVMNGDLLTKLDFAELLDTHIKKGSAATMAVREYSYQVPFGVINCDGDRIVSIEEKPEHTYFVNAGIYVLNPEIAAKVDKEEFFDMPDLFKDIIREGGKVGFFPIREYWLDIGRLDDFERAKSEFGGGI